MPEKVHSVIYTENKWSIRPFFLDCKCCYCSTVGQHTKISKEWNMPIIWLMMMIPYFAPRPKNVMFDFPQDKEISDRLFIDQ